MPGLFCLFNCIDERYHEQINQPHNNEQQAENDGIGQASGEKHTKTLGDISDCFEDGIHGGGNSGIHINEVHGIARVHHNHLIIQALLSE